MTDLEALARAEQAAQAPEPPLAPQLFDADQQKLLMTAALLYRLAALTIEEMAITIQPAMRDANIRGAARFASQAAETYAGVLLAAGLEER